GTDDQHCARFDSGVIPLPPDHRGLRTRHHEDTGPFPAATDIGITRFAELVARAVVAGYRDQHNVQSLDDEPRHPVSIDSLLEGRVADGWAIGKVANQLRLPMSGAFVVVAAEVSSLGSEAMPGIDSKLRSLDVYSAWRLLPDVHVGIVHIHSEPQLDKVL